MSVNHFIEAQDIVTAYRNGNPGRIATEQVQAALASRVHELVMKLGDADGG